MRILFWIFIFLNPSLVGFVSAEEGGTELSSSSASEAPSPWQWGSPNFVDESPAKIREFVESFERQAAPSHKGTNMPTQSQGRKATD